MNNKMLKLGIDEFTLTIFPKEKEIISKWINTASSIIEHFSTTTKIESILNGKLEEMRHNKLQGYTTAYNLGSKVILIWESAFVLVQRHGHYINQLIS